MEKMKIGKLAGLSFLVLLPCLVQALPQGLVFSANYNDPTLNANLSLTGNLPIRLAGMGETDTWGPVFQGDGAGKWGGGMKAYSNNWSTRARYDLPSGFDPNNGMVEVWFKTSDASSTITLIDLGGENYVRWNPGAGKIVGVLAGTNLQYVVNASVIGDGNWHHVAVSWCNVSGIPQVGKRLFFDGQEQTWNPGHTTALSGVSYIGIGSIWCGGAGEVDYDELHLYDGSFYSNGSLPPGYAQEVGPLPQAIPTAPNGLIFGANYNQSTINANLNTTSSSVIRSFGPNANQSFGFLAQVPGMGRWNGAIQVCADNWNSRVRYEVPSSFDVNNGLVEVWFRFTGTNGSPVTLLDLGGNNYVRWINATNENNESERRLVAVIGGATVWKPVANLDNGQWHQVAISWADSSSSLKGKRLFLDGNALGWNVEHTTAISGVSYIGLGEPGCGGDGDILFDDLHVYTGAVLNQMYMRDYGSSAPGWLYEVPLPDAVATTAQHTINTAATGTAFSPGVRGHHPECVGVTRGEYIRGIPKMLTVSEGTMLRGLAAGLKAETYDWRNRFEYGVPANGVGQPTIDFMRYDRDYNSSLIVTVNTRGLTRLVGTDACEYYDGNISTLSSLAADWVRYTNYIVQNYRMGDAIGNSRDVSIINSLSWKTAGQPADQFEPLLFAQETAVPKVTYWEIGNEPMAPLYANNYVAYMQTTTQFYNRYRAIVTAMKAEDPTIKVGPSSTPKPEGIAFLQPILNDLTLPVDIVYYHSHMRGDLSNMEGSSTLEEFLNTIYSDQVAIKSKVTSAIAAAGRNPANIPLAITEWGPTDPGYTDSAKVGRMVHALASFEMVFSFARMGIFDANYMKWPADARDGTEYPVFLGWQALNDHMGDTLVDIHTENNFHMYTTRDSATGKIVIWGLNFSDSTDKTMPLALNGLGVDANNVTWLRLGTADGAGSLESYNQSGLDYYGLSVTEVGLHKANINGASVSNLPFYVPRASMCVLVIDNEAKLKVFPQEQTVFWPATDNIVSFTTKSIVFNVTNRDAGWITWSSQVIEGSDWLTITSGTSGSNSGQIFAKVTENPYASARTGIIRVTSGSESRDLAVVQGGKTGGIVLASLNVTPTSRSVSFKAGSTTFGVSNGGSGTMNWTAVVTGGSSWLTISSGSTGTNTGTVTVTITANTSGAQRTGTIRIAAAGATNSPVDVTVVQPAAIPGDANLDGMVDVGDLGILAANYGGSNKNWGMGDFNHDGMVDVGDLGILAANYGQGTSSTTTADFSNDYEKAFGTSISQEDENDVSINDSSICSGLGLPLLVGLLLAGLGLTGSLKQEE
jgi:hypothetical protein